MAIPASALVGAPLEAPGAGAPPAHPGGKADLQLPGKHEPGAGPDAANCSLGSAAVELANGVGTTGNLADVADANCEFFFVPDTGFQVASFVMTLTTSDFDLYVKKGSPPTTTSYDCRPFSGGTTTETCSVDITDGTTLYAMVRRFSGSGDFTITVTQVNPCALGRGPHTLTAGVNTTATLDGTAGGSCVFAFDTTANTIRVNMTPAAAADNFNLYLRRGSPPGTTTGTFDCSSTLTGASTDSCLLTNNGQTVYARVFRPAAGAQNTFNLRADGLSTCSLGDGALTLAPNNANVTATLTAFQHANCLFRVDGEAGFDMVRAELFPASSSHNFNLAVRVGAIPTPTAADCFSNLTGTTTDVCTVTASGPVYALVHRPSSASASADFNVRARSVQGCSLGLATTALQNNVPLGASLGNEAGAACNFVFHPPANEDTVRVAMTPPATGGDFDLYVRKGAAPTTTVYDCRSLLTGNATESCTLPNDGASVYAMVRRFSGSGAFTITATAFSPCSFGNGNRALAEGAEDTASLSNDAGAACFYTFTTLPLADVAVFDLDPEAGDFDLYVQVGSRPTTSSYACRSIGAGAGLAETCRVAGDGVVFHAMVLRSSGSGSFSLRATSASTCSLGIGVHTLRDGQTTTASLEGVTSAKCYFSFAPAAADFAQFTMAPATSDFDLYVRKGALPTTSAYDCRPFSGGTTVEDCFMLLEDATPYQVMVRRFSGSGSFDLTARNVVLHDLADGMPVVGNVAQGRFAYYKVTVPEGATHLTIATGGDPVNRACNTPAGANPACGLLPGIRSAVCSAIAELCPVVGALTTEACGAVAEACRPLPRTDVDLYVRHISDLRSPRGLPTTSLHTCASASPGSVEQCTFDTQVRDGLAAALAQLPPSPAPLPPGILPSVHAGPQPGKYFVAVRGVAGPADYAIAAAQA